MSATLPSLAAIQARADAATEGPWKVYSTRGGTYVTRPDLLGVAREWSLVWQAEDAAFIAAARTDVPVLVAALRAVLDLHRPEDWRGTGVLVCAHCRPAWTGSNRATYPCDTVRAITAHIDTTPKGADRG